MVHKNLEEALRQLKRDPSHPVCARVDDLTVELRAVEPIPTGKSAAELFDAIGPWEGETTDEILRLLADARNKGGTRSVPSL